MIPTWGDAHAAIVCRFHQSPERFPLHVLEHQEELVFGGDHVESRYDVLVADSGDDPRFVDETRAESRILCELRV